MKQSTISRHVLARLRNPPRPCDSRQSARSRLCYLVLASDLSAWQSIILHIYDSTIVSLRADLSAWQSHNFAKSRFPMNKRQSIILHTYISLLRLCQNSKKSTQQGSCNDS